MAVARAEAVNDVIFRVDVEDIQVNILHKFDDFIEVNLPAQFLLIEVVSDVISVKLKMLFK